MDQVANRMTVKFLHNVVSVGPGGREADPQNVGDFLITLALCQKLNDFALTRAERVREQGDFTNPSPALQIRLTAPAGVPSQI